MSRIMVILLSSFCSAQGFVGEVQSLAVELFIFDLITNLAVLGHSCGTQGLGCVVWALLLQHKILLMWPLHTVAVVRRPTYSS